MNAKAWKACAKKWRSIVKQVDAECMQATECEMAAKRETRAAKSELYATQAQVERLWDALEEATYNHTDPCSCKACAMFSEEQ